jgi:hypothetical protein
MYDIPISQYERALIGSMLPDGFISQIMCAGWPGERFSACHGDSGGPLAKFIHPYFQQLGNNKYTFNSL